jgi:hypothetical protein
LLWGASIRVNVSGITRTLPRHLPAAFRAELTERLMDQHVTAEDIRTVAAD